MKITLLSFWVPLTALLPSYFSITLQTLHDSVGQSVTISNDTDSSIEFRQPTPLTLCISNVVSFMMAYQRNDNVNSYMKNVNGERLGLIRTPDFVFKDATEKGEKMTSATKAIQEDISIIDDMEILGDDEGDSEIYDVSQHDPAASRRRRRRRSSIRRRRRSSRRRRRRPSSNAVRRLNLAKLDDAPAYFDLGPVQASSCNTYYYMCTRNNNFSNRSQKGKIHVVCPKA